MVKYFSMFSGVGGFELGIQRAFNRQKESNELDESSRNMQNSEIGRWVREYPLCVGVCEWDKYASQLLAKKFPEVRNYGDATKIRTDELEDFDLLVGGFPCQAFSIAGKRRGFEDTRGTLFFEIARVLKAKRPKSFVLENVKGLLSHNKGETFRVIIDTLTELGYDVQWMVLNSKFFGVPQNRERVFITGSLRGTSRPEILPFGEIQDENNKSMEESESTKTSAFSTIKAGYSHGMQNDWTLLYDSGIRRITPLECERLQGFPDGWTEGFSDTQRYKMIGNAVTVNVVETIMRKLL